MNCFRCNVWPCECSDGITIIHADCREVLRQLPAVDLLLTDPPYGIDYATNHRAKGHKMRSPVVGDSSLDAMRQAWPDAVALLRDDRHWYAFASPRMVHEAIPAVGNVKHVICWDKGDRGTVGDLECGFGEAWEAILYGMKGRRALNGPRPRTVIRYDWSASMDPVHPTVKPVPLLKKLIAWSTLAGELVLDPFCGSGTTLVAAKLTGRRAIGIEVVEDYCRISAGRLRQGVLEFSD